MRTLSLLLSIWLLTVVAIAQTTDVDDSIVVNPRHVPYLFSEVGETTRFQGKVGKLAADFKLVMQADESIIGSYTYPGRKQVYTLKGVMNDVGDITLTEYTIGKPTATCELIPKGDCYAGQMKNTDGRSFSMTMCLQHLSKTPESKSLVVIKEELAPKEELASNVELTPGEELTPKEELASSVESDSISDNEPSFTETYGLLLILVLPITAFFVVWSLVKRFNPQGASSFLESVRSFNEVNTSGLIKGLVVAGGLVLAFNKCSNSTPSHNETEGSAYNYVNKKNHCTWCGKEYSGGGYIHVMDGCEAATGTFAGIGQCSEKCCYDSWNSGRK